VSGHGERGRFTPAGALRQDATYLITGGLGALGLQLAGWLSEQGATIWRCAPAGRRRLRSQPSWTNCGIEEPAWPCSVAMWRISSR